MDRVPTTDDEATAPPMHGYRGAPAVTPVRPCGLTVAVSREAGARGGTIAKAVGRLLGWQVFDHEMLDFLLGNTDARADLLAEMPGPTRDWADARCDALVRDRGLDASDPLAELARLTLTLAARGETVLVGRAAGFLLPAESTVHVRVVAPAGQRIAYLAQWLRLTHDEAAAEMARRDDQRAAMLTALAGRDAADPTGYDLVLNSARLGLESCAELIAHAVRAKRMTSDAGHEPAANGPGER